MTFMFFEVGMQAMPLKIYWDLAYPILRGPSDGIAERCMRSQSQLHYVNCCVYAAEAISDSPEPSRQSCFDWPIIIMRYQISELISSHNRLP